MAYSTMNGVMMPGVSAGSNHVGASATCEAHVIWPTGAAEPPDCAHAGPPVTSVTAAARATRDARERVMVCPPLHCDKDGALAGREVARLSPNPFACQWGQPPSQPFTAIAALEPVC